MPSSVGSAKDTAAEDDDNGTNTSGEPNSSDNNDPKTQQEQRQDDSSSSTSSSSSSSSIRISPLKYALRNFTSQFFLIPQGTGILAVVLHQLNYQFYGLVRISQVFWVITIILLVLFLALYALRVVVFPRQVWKAWGTEIMETAGLSSISIAYTTIIQMIALNLVGDWGTGWGLAAHALWWVNVALALVAAILIPYVITRLEAPGIDAVPPGILLPMIAALTVAAGGGVICRYAALDAGLQVPVIVVSYLFVGLALPLAILVHGVVLARLLDKGAFPKMQSVYQLMIMCGPLGQGSFALQILGQCVQRGAFAEYNESPFLSATGAAVVSTSSQFLGLLTWGYGIFWWAYACMAILQHLAQGPKKALARWDTSLSSWSLVFPWGVFTNAAIELGTILNSRAFKVWSAILTVLLVILWLLNAGATLAGTINGKVFGLDRGWRGKYYVRSAETQKEEAEQATRKAR